MFDTVSQYTECLSFLVNHEPCIQHSFNIVGDCMYAKKPFVLVNNKPLMDSFTSFFDRYFMQPSQLFHRYNMYCGFVPWTVAVLASGERVPKLLPIGSFSWEVKCVSKEERRKYLKRRRLNKHTPVAFDAPTGGPVAAGGASGYGGASVGVGVGGEDDDENCNTYVEQPFFLKYHVKSILPICIVPRDIIVSCMTEPSLPLTQHRSGNSGGFRTATVGQNPSSTRFDGVSNMFSPLCSVVYSYHRLERAQHRRSYADDWNTTARIVTSNAPPRMQTDAPNMELLDGLAGSSGPSNMAHSIGSYSYDNMQLRFSSHDAKVQDILTKDTGSIGQHCPAVYTLPQHYKLERMDNLIPVEDIAQLSADFRVAVSNITGVPVSLLSESKGGQALNSSSEDPVMTDLLLIQLCQRVGNLIEDTVSGMYAYIYDHGSATKAVARPLRIKWNFSHITPPEPPKPTAAKPAAAASKSSSK